MVMQPVACLIHFVDRGKPCDFSVIPDRLAGTLIDHRFIRNIFHVEQQHVPEYGSGGTETQNPVIAVIDVSGRPQRNLLQIGEAGRTLALSPRGVQGRKKK